MPSSAMPAQQHAQRDLVGAHQSGGRLVEQQHARPHGQRAGDLDQAAVDMRQVAGRRRQRAVVADEGKQPLGRPALFLRGMTSAQHAAEPAAPQPDQHIVEHAHRAEQLRGLVGAGDAGARHLPGRRSGKLVVAQADAAGVRPVEAADHVEHGGLAGAVRPDHAGDVAGLGDKATPVAALMPPKAMPTSEIMRGCVVRPRRLQERRQRRNRRTVRACRVGTPREPRQRAEHALGRQPEHDQQQPAEEQQSGIRPGATAAPAARR